MIDTDKLPFFVTAAFLVIVIPGPSVFYIITRSVDCGRHAGIVSTLGVAVGALIHVMAAALGLSALLASSAVAFNTIKYLGAAYLIYLGIRRLTARENGIPDAGRGSRSLGRMFHEGLLTNLLNPKTALFFLAFLPQFADPARGGVTTQVMLLGAIFVVIGIVSDGVYALLAGSFGHWLRRRASGVQAMQRYFSGGVYIALGVATAFSGSGRGK